MGGPTEAWRKANPVTPGRSANLSNPKKDLARLNKARAAYGLPPKGKSSGGGGRQRRDARGRFA